MSSMVIGSIVSWIKFSSRTGDAIRYLGVIKEITNGNQATVKIASRFPEDEVLIPLHELRIWNDISDEVK